MPDQPGWYPDPADRDAAARWWDGSQWTAHVRPGTPQPAVGHATLVSDAARPVPVWEAPPTTAFRLPGPDNWLTNNVVSLMAMLSAVIYVVVLFHGAVFVFGLFPVTLAAFGYELHERLAVAALVIGALTFVANIVASMNFF